MQVIPFNSSDWLGCVWAVIDGYGLIKEFACLGESAWKWRLYLFTQLRQVSWVECGLKGAAIDGLQICWELACFGRPLWKISCTHRVKWVVRWIKYELKGTWINRPIKTCLDRQATAVKAVVVPYSSRSLVELDWMSWVWVRAEMLMNRRGCKVNVYRQVTVKAVVALNDSTRWVNAARDEY
jgi:hypothetical protein